MSHNQESYDLWTIHYLLCDMNRYLITSNDEIVRYYGGATGERMVKLLGNHEKEFSHVEFTWHKKVQPYKSKDGKFWFLPDLYTLSWKLKPNCNWVHTLEADTQHNKPDKKHWHKKEDDGNVYKL